MLEDVLEVSDEIIRLVASLPNRTMGAAALAVALGRVCSQPGVSIDGAVELVRIAAEPEAASTGTRLVTALSGLGLP